MVGVLMSVLFIKDPHITVSVLLSSSSSSSKCFKKQMKFSLLDYTDNILKEGHCCPSFCFIQIGLCAGISWSRIHSCGMWHHVQQNSFNMKSDNQKIFAFYQSKHHSNRYISGKCSESPPRVSVHQLSYLLTLHLLHH